MHIYNTFILFYIFIYFQIKCQTLNNETQCFNVLKKKKLNLKIKLIFKLLNLLYFYHLIVY